MDTQSLLTIEQAGQRLGLKRSMTYKLIATGELGSIKIGKARRVPVRLLDQYVDRLIAEQTGAAA